MDLNTLQQLMGSQAADATANTVLTDRLAEAKALRGSVPQAERTTGYVDPLSVITSLIQGSKGRKQVAELQPQQEAAQRRVNELASAKEQYGLTLAADKIRQAQANKDRTHLAGREDAANVQQNMVNQQTGLAKNRALLQQNVENKAEVAATAEATRQKELADKLLVESGEREEVMKVNPKTGKTEALLIDKKGNLYRNGTLIENSAEWKNYEKPTSGRGRGADQFASPTAKQQTDLETTGNELVQTRSVIGEYKPEFAGGTVPFGGTASNIAARMAPAAATQAMKDKQAWWAKYDLMYTLPDRNSLFGSALTGPERAAWNQAAIGPDMDDSQIAPRLKELEEIKTRVAKRMGENALIKGWDEKWVRNNLGAFLDGEETAPPQGVSAEDWNSLDDEEKAYLLENPDMAAG